MGWEETQTGVFIDFEKRIRDKMDKNIDRPYKPVVPKVKIYEGNIVHMEGMY
jgi:hypothetical protein